MRSHVRRREPCNIAAVTGRDQRLLKNKKQVQQRPPHVFTCCGVPVCKREAGVHTKRYLFCFAYYQLSVIVIVPSPQQDYRLDDCVGAAVSISSLGGTRSGGGTITLSTHTSIIAHSRTIVKGVNASFNLKFLGRLGVLEC